MSENKLNTRNGNGALQAEQLDRRPVVAPPVDIYENRDEILVLADVPGAHNDGITIRLDKNELYLHARRDEVGAGPAVGGGAGRPADYSRTFIVPQGIDGDRITAEMTAGVLRIHLPKRESVKPRRIEVRAS
jgi:HSP20 family molecular chaperone IbpA